MAVRTGQVLNVELIRGNDDAVNGESTTALFRAVIYCDHAGTDVTTSDTLSIPAVPTAIQNARQDGKTVTMRYVGGWGNAYNATDAAVVTMATVAISSAAITFAPKTSDYSTAADIDTTDVLSRPFQIEVAYSVA